MKNKDSLRKVEFLVKLWAISYIVFGFVCSIYVAWYHYRFGVPPIAILSGYQIVTLLVMIAYFIPLLLTIFHLSKKQGIKKYKMLALVALILKSIWSLGMLALTIVELVQRI